MKKLKILMLMLCLVFASVTAAQAQPIVLGTFSIGSLTTNILGEPTADGFSLSVEDISIFGGNGFFSGVIDLDPSISFGFGLVNPNAVATPVSFTLGPVATGVLTGSTDVFASLGVTVTDADLSGAASAAANNPLPNGALTMEINKADANIWDANAPVVVTTLGNSVTNSANNNFPDMPATNDQFSLSLDIMLSASDALGVTGVCRYEEVVVPIPGSLVLLGTGLFGLVGIGIRRKSA